MLVVSKGFFSKHGLFQQVFQMCLHEGIMKSLWHLVGCPNSLPEIVIEQNIKCVFDHAI